MRISNLAIAAAAVLAMTSPGLAADFDGSKPFLCSSIDVATCGPGDACTRASAAAANAPEFFVVDVQKGSVVDTSVGGGARTSKIAHTEHLSEPRERAAQHRFAVGKLLEPGGIRILFGESVERASRFPNPRRSAV